MIKCPVPSAPAVQRHEEGCLRLTIANNIKGLAESLDQLNGFLKSTGVSPKLAYAASLALEELVSNTIKYGYDDGDQHHIDLVFRMGPPAVMTIEDNGRPFNPLEDGPLPDLHVGAEGRPIGGLGLHIVRTLAASLNYRHVDGLNRVNIVFSRDSP